MRPEIVDISVPLDASIPTWPGSPEFSIRRHLAIESGDDANASEIRTDVHSGTHVDVPLHFIPGGADLESTGLDPFIGPCTVVDVVGVNRIGRETLDGLGIASDADRLLLRTNPHTEWFGLPFDEDFAALTVDGAQWIVEQGFKLVGIDYVSIQRFEDGPETHQILLGNDVCILEGLDLREAPPGPYDLTCLPIRLASAEAAPARAILRSTA